MFSSLYSKRYRSYHLRRGETIVEFYEVTSKPAILFQPQKRYSYPNTGWSSIRMKTILSKPCIQSWDDFITARSSCLNCRLYTDYFAKSALQQCLITGTQWINKYPSGLSNSLRFIEWELLLVLFINLKKIFIILYFGFHCGMLSFEKFKTTLFESVKRIANESRKIFDAKCSADVAECAKKSYNECQGTDEKQCLPKYKRSPAGCLQNGVSLSKSSGVRFPYNVNPDNLKN